jgi:hypothetical protein
VQPKNPLTAHEKGYKKVVKCHELLHLVDPSGLDLGLHLLAETHNLDTLHSIKDGFGR